MLEQGSRIGRYELARVLGRGGMGTVYAAEFVGPGGYRKPVAIKVLEQGAEALEREARLGGLLRHRNLVDVYEVGEEDGRWFAAMELCPGGTLSAHLPLPPTAVVDVALQVCAALAYAHDELGLVHLDLKPDNLLLTVDGTVKVADLGIARAEGFREDGRIRGTLGFMPPEQARGEPLDARADIYALGRTLLELATSGPTRSSGTLSVDELVEGSASGQETLDFDRIATLEPTVAPVGVPPELGAVIERCTAPNPDDRYASMADLASALRALPAYGPGLREALGVAAVAVEQDRDGLPAPGDAFFGRGADLVWLAQALARPGVTLVKGTAGIGKSRLALEAALRWREETGGPAWWLPVAELRTLDGLLIAVATALDAPLARGGREDHIRQLGHAIAARGSLLLVFDGFDPLVDLAPVIERWRGAAPDARLLVTSRSAMALDAQVRSLAPLSVEASRELLVARAERRGAAIAREPRLGELASRLDGLPLALELAAGRLGVLTVDDVLERLGLSLLRAGTGDRHDTLRAALDWSWEALSTEEQRGLAELSVFSGGFTLEAAESVLRVGDPVALLGRLMDHSLVLTPEDARFGLLSSVREYAGEKLGPADGDAARARHGQWFARLGARLGPIGSAPRLRTLTSELDNLATACRTAAVSGAEEVAAATLKACWEVMEMAGPYVAAVELAAHVAESATSPEPRARARRIHGAALRLVGELDEAREQLAGAVADAREAGSRALEGAALGRRAVTLWLGGDTPGAEADYRRAAALARETGERRLLPTVLANLGVLLAGRGAMDESWKALDDSLQEARSTGNVRAEGVTVGLLATMHHEAGRLAKAETLYRRAIEVSRGVGDRRNEAASVGNLGICLRQQGQMDAAFTCYQTGLALARELGNRRTEGHILGNLGVFRFGQGTHDEARAFYLQSLEVVREVGDRHYEALVLGNLGEMHAAAGEEDVARARFMEALAVHAEVENARMLGWTLVQLGRLDLRAGALDAALERLARAEDVLVPDDAPFLCDLWTVRALTRHARGETLLAREALSRAEQVAPEDHVDSASRLAEARAVLAGG
ncbi:MAG: tetratricopeptide repeat protein [Deltaproteobacteria bacterium]|nr:MAG: tetratricopeptide repeat protein [Deltaproteobacteria bacterium]